MLHVVQDAAQYGALDHCGAFPFENFLQQLKRLVRSGKNQMGQIVKRLSIYDNLMFTSPTERGKILARKA